MELTASEQKYFQVSAISLVKYLSTGKTGIIMEAEWEHLKKYLFFSYFPHDYKIFDNHTPGSQEDA